MGLGWGKLFCVSLGTPRCGTSEQGGRGVDVDDNDRLNALARPGKDPGQHRGGSSAKPRPNKKQKQSMPPCRVQGGWTMVHLPPEQKTQRSDAMMGEVEVTAMAEGMKSVRRI